MLLQMILQNWCAIEQPQAWTDNTSDVKISPQVCLVSEHAQWALFCLKSMQEVYFWFCVHRMRSCGITCVYMCTACVYMCTLCVVFVQIFYGHGGEETDFQCIRVIWLGLPCPCSDFIDPLPFQEIIIVHQTFCFRHVYSDPVFMFVSENLIWVWLSL